MIKKYLALLTGAMLVTSCGGGGSGGLDSVRLANPPIDLAAALPGADSPEVRQRKYDAHKLLEQATFGPTLDALNQVANSSKEQWIDEQMALPATLMLPQLSQISNPRWAEYVNIWWRTAVTAPDQLRQRVAFALSEIFVISARDGFGAEQAGLANYYDLLVNQSFGNYRDLLSDITRNPVMGDFLSMKGNHKPDPERNIRPDENYARELLQLFSIGLESLNLDGSVKRDSTGTPIPTYDQDTVEGFAHVFTGWHFSNADNFLWSTQSNYISPMTTYPEYHDTGPKVLLDGYRIDGGKSAIEDLNLALDNIFYHPNVGPFISKQLIQRLVTSNPSPQYIEDIATVFNADSQGIRGSLGSVIKAILLHDEAQNGHERAPDTFGKLKEPVIRLTALWRAFMPVNITPDFDYSWSGNEIGQAPLNSPSVFNFFTPSFSQPGDIRNRGLVSPEFQIHDESSIVRLTSRLLSNSIWGHNHKYESSRNRMALNIDLPVALEDYDPDALLDHLNLVLLGGDMSDALRTEAKTLMNSFITESAGPQRTIEAIFLIVSAPESAIQF